jgi:hypothetical protein
MTRLVWTWVVVAFCGLSCVLLSTDAAWADRKVALVVGNTQYRNPSLVLLNPKNDAEDVAAALRALDFEVVLVVNAGKRDFDSAITQFSGMAVGADAALFYYAGHAMQYQGRNYLMPTDGELEDESSLRRQTVMIDDVRAAVERADGVKIVVLDACRNNPALENLRKKMVGTTRNIVATTRGLARPDKALGMIVAYSTAADEVAADGTGRNSPFTSALLRRLSEPGLEIGSMFRLIAADVNEKTNGRQRPETYISLIGEYYLNEKDKPAWEKIKDSTDPAAFRGFIAQFPTSPRASDAQYRLRILERLAKQFDLNGSAGVEASGQPSPGQRDAVQVGRPTSSTDNSRTNTAAIEPQRPQPATGQPKGGRVEHEQGGIATEPAKTSPMAIRLTQEQVCKRDADWLVRVRASQSLGEVISLERELGCERLRPQVLRLMESLGLDAPHADVPVIASAGATRSSQITPRSSIQVIVPPPAQAPEPASQGPRTEAQPAIPPLDDACKHDEEKLVRLRASPSLDQIVRFEQELRCTRLRPQIARLRESVGAN